MSEIPNLIDIYNIEKKVTNHKEEAETTYNTRFKRRYLAAFGDSTIQTSRRHTTRFSSILQYTWNLP